MPIYWALLTYALLRPSIEKTDHWFLFSGIDKVVHFIFFLVLGFMFKMAYPKITLHYFSILLFSYALFTEILQEIMTVGRTGDVYDLIADVLGFLLGFWIVKKLVK